MLQAGNILLDRFFVGHLPDAALTAYGAATSVIFLLFTMAVCVATGTTALVSRSFGANEPSEYRRAAREGLSLAGVSSVVVGLLAVLGARAASTTILPSSDHPAQHQMTLFLMLYAISLPATFIIQTLAGALRGIGNTKSAMYISGLQIFLHATLNSLLVFDHIGPIKCAGWGLLGTVAALTTSAWISAIIYIVYSSKTPLGSCWTWKLPHKEWAFRILRIATPQAMNGLLRISSLTIFTIVLAMVPNGSNAIGAMSIAFAIESIMTMPAFGLAAAAGALVGQSLGMDRPDRAEKLGWTASLHGALVTFALAIPVFFISAPLAGVLVGDKSLVITETSHLLKLLAFSEMGFAYAMILFGAMQGAGDTSRPFWISLASLWGMRVPLAFTLAIQLHQPLGALFGKGIYSPVGYGLGALGAWISMSITQGIQGILALFAFKQGRWKTQRV